jgi:hypothetical protein
MANYTTAADIIDAILFASGEPTTGTSDYETRALELLNRAHRELCLGGGPFAPEITETWWWFRKATPGVLILEPAIVSLTASITNNSDAVTLSAVVNKDLDNWFFKVAGHPDIFRVSDHTSGAATLTLDSVYTGTTNTAAACTLFKAEYSLASDCLTPLSPMRTYRDNRREIEGVDFDALERDYPLGDIESGVPHCFAVKYQNSGASNDGLLTIRLSHYGANGSDSTDIIRADYEYLRRPSDLTNTAGSIPMPPPEYRAILADMATAYLLAEKDDTKSPQYAQAAAEGIRAMARDRRQIMALSSRNMGKINPRIGDLPRNMTPLRTSSGAIIG